MINCIQDHPVSRMPSFHTTFALFKEHQCSIIGGLKTGINSDKGTYIINPSQDLKKMETRLQNFFNFWKPSWSGLVGVTPSADEFTRILTSGHIFS